MTENLPASAAQEGLARVVEGSREIAEALGFEPDNHHNALLCPYCGDQRDKIEREVRERVARDIEASGLLHNGGGIRAHFAEIARGGVRA